jgi:hypothetical protein
MSKFWTTDPTDPEAPVVLAEYNGLRPGMHVRYQNPAWQQPDGSYRTGGMDPPLVISELVRFSEYTEDGGGYVTAVINDGEWEVSADNLVPDPEQS